MGDFIKMEFPNGAKGIRIVSGEGIEIEIVKNKTGTASVELKKYDEEGDGACFGIKLTKKEVLATVELLEPMLRAVRNPGELLK
jgi:hypothetical protein